MGMGAASLAPKSLVTPPGVQGPEEVEITGGTLTALGDGWLEFQKEDQLRRLAFNGNTSFWKGGEITPYALAKGDEVMIRALVPRGLALRVWSNLSRVGGVVVRVAEKGYVLGVSDLHTSEGELMLEISERTLFGDYMTHSSIGKDKGVISEGDYLDAIGERIPEGLRTTLVYHHAERGTSRHQPVPQVEVAGQKRISPEYTKYYYLGYAGWFNCPTGAGRCGTCSTSSSRQTAWPALDTCGCCSWNCCDCSKGCKNQVYLWCGKWMEVSDICQGKTRWVYIVDCGPCQKANCGGCSPELCSRQCSDCRGYYGAVIDLTKPTFAWFYDPAYRGCFSCLVEVTVYG
jgi:hypothetical protein